MQTEHIVNVLPFAPDRFDLRVNKSIDSGSALRLTNEPTNAPTNRPANGHRMRRIAILAADGADTETIIVMQTALKLTGAQSRIVAPRVGMLTGAGGPEVKVDCSLLTISAALFDTVYIPGGSNSIATLRRNPAAMQFINEAYRQCKTVVATGEGCQLLQPSRAPASSFLASAP